MSKDGILIDKEWFLSIGGQQDMPVEGREQNDYGLTVYGWDDDSSRLPNIHIHILISFMESGAEVYIEEFDDGGRANGTVQLPMIKTRVDLLSLLDCFGVVRECSTSSSC